MNIIKKLFMAVTAIAAVSVFMCAQITVSAAILEPSDTAPYTICMSIQAGSEKEFDKTEENSVEVFSDGTYTTTYTFTTGSSSIELLTLDSSINAYNFAPAGSTDPVKDGSVSIKVDKIELQNGDGTLKDIISYNGPSDGAFRTADNGKCYRLNILNQWLQPSPVSDIFTSLPERAKAGDKLVVTFTIAGLGNATAAPAATTTTTNAIISGNSFNSTTITTTSAATASSTGTVTKTADPGLTIIMVSAGAAAALAAGAMTVRRKRK